MKKLIFAASLSALFMAGCNNTPQNVQDVGTENTNLVNREVSGQIAYINLDTLMQGYEMYLDLMAEFETKAKKAESDITSRGRSIERAAADAQNKIEKGLVTRAEIAQLQEDLQRREQSFYQFRDNLQMELAEENQVMTNRIFYSIDDYIKEFNSDYRYGMIFTTSSGAPILHADPALDITNLILTELNARYMKEKNSK